jgi:hypothetical protein
MKLWLSLLLIILDDQVIGGIIPNAKNEPRAMAA